MHTPKAVVDPLWQCLCPSWTPSSLVRANRFLHYASRAAARPCAKQLAAAAPLVTPSRNRRDYSLVRLDAASRQYDTTYNPLNTAATKRYGEGQAAPQRKEAPVPLEQESTPFLYGRLRAAAVQGKTRECREVAEFLVRERGEEPSVALYNALIASNVHHADGAAWRVGELLDEMRTEGLEPDAGSCHAVLKVLAVHVDHLLRADVLEYMRRRWYTVSDEGAHDVAAGLLREGLFEQALQQLDAMRSKMPVDGWLWDMAVYMLCDAGEIEEAARIMRMRYDGGDMNLNRNLWHYLLDHGSKARNHAAASFVWSTQVNPGYVNPSSGTCLNVLATAAAAGDAALGTAVFTQLSKRGAAFQPIHYELLIAAYLAQSPPDLTRALSILTIMPLEKLEPTPTSTRALFTHLHARPELLEPAFQTVRELHAQTNRQIPIALLNLLIECHVAQRTPAGHVAALKLYKLIHTFAAPGAGAQKSFANIDTFNLLLKGCRHAETPDDQTASFLVSELLALRITPTALTYDRLMLVFIGAAQHALAAAAAEAGAGRDGSRKGMSSKAAKPERARGLELLDWAFRHFVDMRPLGWMPRFGTLEQLAVELARAGDARCWDVLQVAEDQAETVEGFAQKGKWIRGNVETAWESVRGDERVSVTSHEDDTEQSADGGPADDDDDGDGNDVGGESPVAAAAAASG